MAKDHVLQNGDRDKLSRLVNAVDLDRKEQFEDLFGKWKRKWFTGEIAFSSDTNANKKLREYAPLKKMGKDITPLLVEKLLDSENFVALVLFDDLQETRKFSIMRKKAAADITKGEAYRAQKTVKNWLADQP
jgi:hypothetical protein